MESESDTAVGERDLNMQHPSDVAIEALAYFTQTAGVPIWALVDSGISYYFRQHEHTAATCTVVFDQIQQEVQGCNARYVLQVFCTLLDGEFREEFLAEVCTLVLQTLQPEAARIAPLLPAASISGPAAPVLVPDSEEPAPTEMDSDADSDATVAYQVADY